MINFLVVVILIFRTICEFSCNAQSSSSEAKDISVYWNVPSGVCRSHKVYFNLTDKFNIIQNDNDEFRGNKISILYDPGFFPALLKNGSSRGYYFRNGGVPQAGDLAEHLNKLEKQIEELIPNSEYKGVAIIDFESWRPVFRQNFGVLTPYREVSYDIERRKHPLWRNQSIITYATFEFEKSARVFMETTIVFLKQLRPNATWGYYAYPYCFNMNGGNFETNCPSPVPRENDRTIWLFDAVDAFMPSLYFNEQKLNQLERQRMIKGRIAESQRLQHLTSQPKLIIPYFWFKYQDSGDYLTREDLELSMTQFKLSAVDGLIIWGSSNDVSSKTKCFQLNAYVENVLGPVIKDILS